MTEQTGFVTNPAAAAAQGRAAWNESFAPVLSELRDVLGKRTPERIAILSGVEWHAGTSEFRFHWLQTPYRIAWPALVAFPADDSTPCPANTQGLFLYYLATADGTPPAQRWIAFRELPEEQRAVVDLRLRQELTLEEIAEIAGVGRETIKSRLRYAMDKLRGRLRA